MNIIRHPDRGSWPGILQRPELNHKKLEGQVEQIIQDVAKNGDDAVRSYTRQFDKVDMDQLEVSRDEMNKAGKEVDIALKKAIEEAHWNILTFHKKQLHQLDTIVTTAGVRCWQKPMPIQKVGLYIPGGSAPLLSTVLMLGIPAKIAGCQEVVLCSPPDKYGKVNPTILYIAKLLGIDRVFSVGGVQAIAAMAHGTESIPAVHKICGPGNQFVTMAKQIVSRETVAIDMPAGPSELAVVADATSNTAFIASDLLSQAEHGPDSQVLLFSDSGDMIGRVQAELKEQLAKLPRRKIAEAALEHSKMILLKDQEEIMDMVNLYAPEHLIIVSENYAELAEKVVNAGSVFLGDYTPESAGDYASGTNHTLPTNGWAVSYSGVNMDSFYKKISYQEISKYGLYNIGQSIMKLAEAEQLQAHSNAVSVRLNYSDTENE